MSVRKPTGVGLNVMSFLRLSHRGFASFWVKIERWKVGFRPKGISQGKVRVLLGCGGWEVVDQEVSSFLASSQISDSPSHKPRGLHLLSITAHCCPAFSPEKQVVIKVE